MLNEVDFGDFADDSNRLTFLNIVPREEFVEV